MSFKPPSRMPQGRMVTVLFAALVVGSALGPIACANDTSLGRKVAGPCNVTTRGPDGRIDSQTSYFYDDLGRVTVTLTVCIGRCEALPIRMETSYDEAGRVSLLEIDQGADGTTDSRIAYQYEVDAEDQVIAKDVDFDADGTLDQRYTYVLDDQGRVAEMHWDSDTDGFDNMVMQYTYDLAGRLVSEERDGNLGDGAPDGQVDERVSYTYDPDDNLVGRDDDLGADGTVNNRTTYEYDDSGNLLNEFHYDGADNTVEYFLVSDYTCWE
jgi:hypothetical protein